MNTFRRLLLGVFLCSGLFVALSFMSSLYASELANSTSLESLIVSQQLAPLWPGNVLRYAISYAVASQVSADTIVLLLLLPVVAAFIAGVRHVVGLRGFGILLPAALSVVFVSTGPVVGIGLFLLIVAVSTFTRLFLKETKIRLQYLPRMAFILWAVVIGVLGVLFITPIVNRPDIANVSIFPVLILVLLSEDFTRVQLGKSVNAAIRITFETLLLAFLSYLLLTLRSLQELALLNPELLLISVAIFDFLMGKYSGLRFMEYYRFRKLIHQK